MLSKRRGSARSASAMGLGVPWSAGLQQSAQDNGPVCTGVCTESAQALSAFPASKRWMRPGPRSQRSGSRSRMRFKLTVNELFSKPGCSLNNQRETQMLVDMGLLKGCAEGFHKSTSQLSGPFLIRCCHTGAAPLA